MNSPGDIGVKSSQAILTVSIDKRWAGGQEASGSLLVVLSLAYHNSS